MVTCLPRIGIRTNIGLVLQLACCAYTKEPGKRHCYIGDNVQPFPGSLHLYPISGQIDLHTLMCDFYLIFFSIVLVVGYRAAGTHK